MARGKAKSGAGAKADETGGGFYQDPVVYEVLHSADAPGDVRMLKRLWRRFGTGRPGVALEPACGPGRHLRLLARDGWDVIGIDLSAAMIEHARRAMTRASDGDDVTARFIAGDMSRVEELVEPGSVDLGFCLINSVRHLPSDVAMVRHLRGMRRVLKPSGVYVVGMSMSWYGHETMSEDVWEGKRRVDGEEIRVKQVVSYEPAAMAEGERLTARQRFEQVYSHLEITRGGEVTHVDHRYRLRTFDQGEWLRVVEKTGLAVRVVLDAHGEEQETPRVGYGVFVLGAR